MDLLSISVGESDYERDRVACLHTCCLEFEPIIFHLNERSGPKEIISSCKKILVVLKKDPDIINKLVSCFVHFSPKIFKACISLLMLCVQVTYYERKGYPINPNWNMSSKTFCPLNEVHLIVVQTYNHFSFLPPSIVYKFLLQGYVNMVQVLSALKFKLFGRSYY